MKYIRKISLALILCAGVFTSCDDNDNVSISGLNIDRSEITVGENGGIEIINIQAASEWTASSDQPWVNSSPASGVGISECIVRIDSSLINDIRTANIRIRPESGLSQNIVVSQTGFEKTISLDVEDVEIDYTAKSSDRYFDIAITTNVLFNINVPQSDNWISFDKDQLDIDLNKGARPRTVKIRFRWNMNVNPEDRISEIGFTSLDEALNLEAILTVKQKSAPLIEDSRSGDSLALMIIQKKIDTYTEFDTG